MSKLSKFFCIVGSVLLLIMGLFHGSGLNWISGEISKSNAEPFLKEVFPVLFAHVSIHLLGMAILGLSLIWFHKAARVVSIFIAAMVMANVVFAFYLGASPPGVLLLCAAICFVLVAVTYSERSSHVTVSKDDA